MITATEEIKISALPPVASLDGSEILLVVKNVGGVLTTCRPTVAQLVALVESLATAGVISVAGEAGAVTAAELKAALSYTAGEVGADASGTAAGAVSAHAAASDPHPQYAKKAPSIVTTITSNTVTPTGDTDLIRTAALTASLTIANPSSTPTDGFGMVVDLIDSGTTRALTWGDKFADRMATLPAATKAGKRHRIGVEYNATDDKFYCMFAGVAP